MSETLITFLKIVIPAFITALLTVYKDEIFNWFNRNRHKHLKGRWDCAWTVDPSVDYPNGRILNDEVEITHVNGTIIKGEGNTGVLGKWPINGKASNTVITISYQPKEDHLKHNRGVIILSIDRGNTNSLKGLWHQHNGNEIVGGTTVWNKKV